MKDLEELMRQTHEIVQRIDATTIEHAQSLESITRGIGDMNRIAHNTEKMATSLEKITDRAMTALEGKSSRDYRLQVGTFVLVGVLLIIMVVAWTRSDFSAIVNKEGGAIHAGKGGEN